MDIGTADDVDVVGSGVGKPRSLDLGGAKQTVRSVEPRFSLLLPTFPAQDNLLTISLATPRHTSIDVKLGTWRGELVESADHAGRFEVRIPASVVANRRRATLQFGMPKLKPKQRAQLAWASVNATSPLQVQLVDFGSPSDSASCVSGLMQPERKPTDRGLASVRSAGDPFVVRLPVYLGQANRVQMRMTLPAEPVRVSSGAWSTVLTGGMDGARTQTFVVPAALVGVRSSMLELKFESSATRRHKTLAVLDWARTTPAPEPAPELRHPAGRSQIPVGERLRGLERRPRSADIGAYVATMDAARGNVVTVGIADGLGHPTYDSKVATPANHMVPGWIPGVVKALHSRDIAVVGWLPFNIQPGQKWRGPLEDFPDWQMSFLPTGKPGVDHYGYCITSSPYREHLGKQVREAAGLGLDGLWFDGFYLGGVPHPIQPGCACRYCRAKFTKDTGLTLPSKVDWRSKSFKRWVRWRNEQLVETARYLAREARGIDADLSVSANTNHWPFASKDWETAVPLWRIDEFGVSEHAHSRRPDMRWLMLGFKSRLAHDLNPNHADIWRPSTPTFASLKGRRDVERHQQDLELFTLSALSHGVVPWRGLPVTMVSFDVERSVNEMLATRERFFSREQLKHVGVLLSENTHTFYGHLPGTRNVLTYEDGILGTWLLLSRSQQIFEFFFDNMLDDQSLAVYDTILLPNAAALSAAAEATLLRWVGKGGRLLLSADTGMYDEWGEKLATARFAQARQKPGSRVSFGAGTLHYLLSDPGLSYVRQRADPSALVDLLRVNAPLVVTGEPALLSNTFWSPDHKQIWVHLLNVSSYLVADDTGFHGLAKTAADAGHARLHRQLSGMRITPGRVRFSRARMGLSGRELKLDAGGGVPIPRLALHEVVVLTPAL